MTQQHMDETEMHLYRLVFPNGKYYFGVSQNSYIRWYDHRKQMQRGTRTPVYYAMRKYGTNVYLQKLVVGSIGYILHLEMACIAAFKTTDRRYGYNVTPGGDTPPMLVPAIRERHYGWRLSEDTRRKLSIIARVQGRKPPGYDGRGRHPTAATLAKLSLIRKGKKKPERFAALMKRRIWITDGQSSQRIEPSAEIPLGWYRGRPDGANGRTWSGKSRRRRASWVK